VPGPPPKADSERRRRNVLSTSTTFLPAEGRDGETPAWPLSKARKAEADLWKKLWITPQAAAWEALGWDRTVARYCRLLVDAEKTGAMTTLLAEVRQMEDRLGLTPMSMLRLRWQIAVDQVAEVRGPDAPAPARRLSAVDPKLVAEGK
jgi:hypothetical protein